MVKEILNAIGIPYKQTRFLKAPSQSYIIYLHDYKVRGADHKNLIKENDITLELYSYSKDEKSESLIEDELNERNIEYKKQSPYWIDSEQLYQTIYEFNYIEKV